MEGITPPLATKFAIEPLFMPGLTGFFSKL